MMPVASFVALLVAAVEALSMMVPTFVFITVVVAAIVSLAVMMAVVVALGIGIILQRAIRQSLRSCIGRTGNAAVEPYSRLGQRSLRTHADAAADQRIHLRGF